MTVETAVRGGIGESVRRSDGIPKVTGEFAYSSDLWADWMLWGATLRSPHPRARIRELDLAPALAVRGVHAVLTHALMELEVRVVPCIELGPADDVALDAAHRRILDAIAARQPEPARAAMHQHIGDLEQRLAEAARERPAC